MDQEVVGKIFSYRVLRRRNNRNPELPIDPLKGEYRPLQGNYTPT